MNFPALVFICSLVVLSFATRLGASLVRWRKQLQPDARDDFGVVLAATLTMLGLIIGFTFSMAVSRYDQRKNLEEEEANAIGTEYLRADLLPATDTARVQALLRDYLDQRVMHYSTSDAQQLIQINTRTTQLQTEMWAAVLPAAAAQPIPTVTLAVSGMNDVLNSQGYAQAAGWNRIPVAAWMLMEIIAVFNCVLVGLSARDVKREKLLLFILPLVVSISFFLIADIDSPRGGVIRVHPKNLESLVESLRAP